MTADAVQPGLGLPVYQTRTGEYLRLLLILLLTASFFDGYDGGILDIIKRGEVPSQGPRYRRRRQPRLLGFQQLRPGDTPFRVDTGCS